MIFRLYECIPTEIKSFLSTNFKTDEKIFNNEFFSNVKSSIILDEQIKAATILKFYKEEQGPWLSYFITDPNFRRQKIGTQLLSNIKERFNCIQLECWSENKTALEFYINQQFKIINRINNSLYLKWVM